MSSERGIDTRHYTNWIRDGLGLLAIAVMAWAMKTILSVSQTQALSSQLLEQTVRRVDKIDTWIDNSNKERNEWMRSRVEKGRNDSR